MASQIVQLAISVKGTSPEVWRVIQLMESSSLRNLRFSICTLMGWIYSDDSTFLAGDEIFGDPEFDYAENGWKDDSKVTLGKIIKKHPRFEFVCGLNKNWICTVEFENLTKAKIDYRYPYCIAGENLAPPEDCEDRTSFEIFKSIIISPKSEEYLRLKRMHTDYNGRKPFNALGFNRKFINQGKLHSRRWTGSKNKIG